MYHKENVHNIRMDVAQQQQHEEKTKQMTENRFYNLFHFFLLYIVCLKCFFFLIIKHFTHPTLHTHTHTHTLLSFISFNIKYANYHYIWIE